MFKYGDRDIRDIVKRKDWQDLRESFIGTWTTKSDENVLKLRKFIGPIQSAELDKLIIVYNYLTGTAFRMGKIKSANIDKLKEEIKKELLKRKKEN